MNGNTKIAVICGGVVLGAAVLGAGIYLGAKYIPYAVEEARHRARVFELEHRDDVAKAKKAVNGVKKGAQKVQKEISAKMPRR